MTYVRRSNYRWYNYNTRRKFGLPRSRPHAMGNPLANMYPHEYAKSTSPMFRKQGLYWYNKNRGRKEFGGNQKDWWASDPVGYRLPPNLSKSFSLRDVGCTRAIGAPPPDYNPYMEDHRRYPISLSASPVFLVDFLITYVAKAWTRAQIQQYLATLARLYPTIDKLRYALIEQEYFIAGGKPDDHVVPFVTTTELMNVWANGRSLLSGSGRILDPHRLPFEDVHSQIHGIMRKEKESGYVPVPENFLKHLVYLTDAIFWQRKVEENRSTLHQKGQLRTMEGEMYYALPYPRGASFPISLAQPEAEQPSRDYADLLDVEIHPIFQLGRFQRENISP